MSAPSIQSRKLRFGVFEIDLDRCELRKHGIRIALQEQPFRLLAALVQRPGDVITREELRGQIWPADTFVDFDRSLNTAVLKVRQALADSATHGRFIETVPRKGYRFVAPVEPIAQNVPAADAGEWVSQPKPGVAHSFIHGRMVSIACLAGAIAVASAIAYKSTAGSPEQPGDWRIRPLTRFAGQESAPSWSSDGRFVAFGRMTGGDANIFVQPVGSQHLTQLTTSPADDMRPRWSPDGQHIAFLSDEGGNKRIYLISPSGGAPRFIADTGIPFLERFADSWKAFGTAPWLPSGDELLFSRLQRDGRTAIWKTNIETKRETQLTFPPDGSDDLLASASFDGEHIVFARRRSGKESLWLVAARGGEPQVLLSDAFDNTIPSFSPDNTRVVFQSDRAGAINLWDMEIGSGRLRRLTSGPGIDMNAVAGRGGGLLFAHHSFDLNLHRLDVATANDERLTSANGWNYQPRFSPDGNRIVYFSGQDGNFELRLLDLRAKWEKSLTDHPAADVAPDWSPHGREIVFASNRDGPFQLWIVDVESGTTRRVLEQTVAATQGVTMGIGQTPAPRWSPDGRSIGFLVKTHSGHSLWRVDPDGQNSRQLIEGVTDFDWYLDGRHVIYSRAAADKSAGREIVIADLATGATAVIYRGHHAEIAGAPDGRSITFAGGQSHFCRELFLLRLTPPSSLGGLPRLQAAPKQLTNGACAWHVHNGGWSRDGKTVVYTRERHEGDLYVIENYR